jgi:hypothetical protein
MAMPKKGKSSTEVDFLIAAVSLYLAMKTIIRHRQQPMLSLWWLQRPQMACQAMRP